MEQNPDFQQDYYCLTANVNYEIGHDSIRLGEWMAQWYQHYGNIYYFDLKASALSVLNNEKSLW